MHYKIITMKKYIVALALATPLFTFAAFNGTLGLLCSVQQIFNVLIPIAFTLALLGFFWGVAKFIFRLGGDEGAVEGGKRIMGWGIIAMFVIVSIWGIVYFIQSELGISTDSSITGSSCSGSSSIPQDPNNGTYGPGF